MKAKKWLIIALALAVALTCLSGCGSKNGSDEIAEGSPVKLNGDAIYPLQCDDTLRYWVELDTGTSQVVSNLGDTPFAKKLEEETGVKIEYVHPTGDTKEQFQLLLAADDLPDLVTYSWNNYPGGPQAAIDDGYIYSLNEIIDKYAPALKKFLAENEDIDKQIKDDNGNYYAFPFGMQKGLCQVAFGPTLRKDWLEKVNMEVPETLEEWEAVLTAFKNQCGATAPLTGTWSEILNLSTGCDTWGGWYIDGGKVKYGFAEDNFKDFLGILNDWYKKGLIDSDIAVNESINVKNNVLTGKSGALFTWAGSGLGQLLTDAETSNTSLDLTGAKFPSSQKGKDPEYSYLSNFVNMGFGVAISKNCKNPELAARFLDYGFTEAGHKLFNFGIEGESYNMVEGRPTYTDLILKNPDGLSINAAMGQYIRASYNGPFIQDTGYIEQYYQRPQQKEAQKLWGESNMKEHLMPTIYISSDVSDKDADIMTNVATYRDEMILKFITGEEPISSFDKYVNQLNAYGLQDAIKYRQEAYNRYLER